MPKISQVSCVEFHSEPDELGRRSFTLTWLADYHPGHPDGEDRIDVRGQCFYADPEQYISPIREEAR